jgi:MFS family permease
MTIFALAQLGLALTPISAYWLLLLLRCVSAAGSAPIVALGVGTIGDIAEQQERGKFMGIASLGPMLGPCIGPVFGGLLDQHWGWRAIFWFLLILSTANLVPFLVFFPETLRSIVGNGSMVPRSFWNRSIVQMVEAAKRKAKGVKEDQDVGPRVLEMVTSAPRQRVNPVGSVIFE